jgi:hypothetical protein
MIITTKGDVFKNNIEILHGPEESAAPPIAFISVSALTILNSALSAHTPPKSILFNTAGTYALYTFPSNIPGTLSVLTATVSAGYFSGAFNRVTVVAGTEITSASAAYFCW